MALEERTITIPDYEPVDANDMTGAFMVELKEAQKQIDALIGSLAGGDTGEIDRIKRIYHRLVCQSLINKEEDKINRIDTSMFFVLSDKEPTLVEATASSSLFFWVLCVHSLRENDLAGAYRFFAYANRFLGWAQGCNRAEKLSDLQKKLIQKAAAQARHAENRMMKEEAIQYYKDNHASFTSKDDAAMRIVEKIVPAKFATVRGWLKGVNPE